MDNEEKDKKKILLVDDDEMQHMVVENMLKNEYEVLKAKSGYDALQYLYDSNCIPDLILLDILIPDMDGWEIFSRIKAISLLKNVPIAFFTSLQESEDEKRAYNMGAVDFIKKPYDGDDFLDRIRRILDNTEEQD